MVEEKAMNKEKAVLLQRLRFRWLLHWYRFLVGGLASTAKSTPPRSAHWIRKDDSDGADSCHDSCVCGDHVDSGETRLRRLRIS